MFLQRKRLGIIICNDFCKPTLHIWCDNSFSNEAMKPSQLQDHLNHKGSEDEDKNAFQKVISKQ